MLAVMHGFIPNAVEGWTYTLDAVGDYFDRALTRSAEAPPAKPPEMALGQLVDERLPPVAYELIGAYLDNVQILGRRTAELHVALASESKDEEFTPEPFSLLYQRSLYQGLRNSIGQVFQLLRERRRTLPEAIRQVAQSVLDVEPEVLRRCKRFHQYKVNALRTRTHGDYHLKQVLWTGKDFVLIDFEGEPARAIGERRIKRSPLRDIASMLRSFQYAAYAARLGAGSRTETASSVDLAAIRPWIDFWVRWVSASFLAAYLAAVGRAVFLPKSRDELTLLIDLYTLDKAIYELRYELENRPDWVRIPLQGILDIIREPQ